MSTEEPMKGLAEYLRQQANITAWNETAASVLRRWASEVEASRASLSAPSESEEWVAQVVPSGPHKFPLLQWRNADVSFSVPIGTKLYAASPEAPRLPEPVAWGMADETGRIYDCISPEDHARMQGEYTTPLYAAPRLHVDGEEPAWMNALQTAVDALDALTDKIDRTGFADSDEFSAALDAINMGRKVLSGST